MLQMDGDSSTTDASQLGITSEYMASGHYVLQSQEGEERECNPHISDLTEGNVFASCRRRRGEPE